MVFQQRNGRIDRYGQEQVPLISYLVIQSKQPKIHGDMRILELLIQKDEEAVKNIGDPPSLMNVYDVETEEAKTAAAIQEGLSPELFEADVLSGAQEDQPDLLSFLEQSQEEIQIESSQEYLSFMPTLFGDDFQYLTQALSRFSYVHDIDPDQRVLEVNMPEDLAHRFRFLPREIQPQNGNIKFTDETRTMQDEIKRCRKDEESWPNLHFLWPLHPVMEWINDKVQTGFRRHEAPVLTLPTLEPEEIIYVLTGIIPNRKGQPLIQRWFGMVTKKGGFQSIEPLETILDRTGLARQSFSNPGDIKISEMAKNLLPKVVYQAQGHMKEVRKEFENQINPKLNDHLKKLESLKARHKKEIQQYLWGLNIAKTLKDRRKNEQEREVESLFAEYMKWIEDTMSTEEQAYIKIGAVLQGV